MAAIVITFATTLTLLGVIAADDLAPALEAK